MERPRRPRRLPQPEGAGTTAEDERGRLGPEARRPGSLRCHQGAAASARSPARPGRASRTRPGAGAGAAALWRRRPAQTQVGPPAPLRHWPPPRPPPLSGWWRSPARAPWRRVPQRGAVECGPQGALETTKTAASRRASERALTHSSLQRAPARLWRGDARCCRLVPPPRLHVRSLGPVGVRGCRGTRPSCCCRDRARPSGWQEQNVSPGRHSRGCRGRRGTRDRFPRRGCCCGCRCRGHRGCCCPQRQERHCGGQRLRRRRGFFRGRCSSGYCSQCRRRRKNTQRGAQPRMGQAPPRAQHASLHCPPEARHRARSFPSPACLEQSGCARAAGSGGEERRSSK